MPSLIAAMLTILLCVGVVPSHCGPPISKYDGTWWERAPREERFGFLAGVVDCMRAERGQEAYRQLKWDVLEPATGAYYADHPSERNAPVLDVFTMLALGRPRPPRLGGGEVWEGKHGFFDGQYWVEASQDRRLGFVEGYLECASTLPQFAGRFPRFAVYYSAEITKWYGTKPPEWNEEKLSVPIADVLKRYSEPSR
jgi:hypothetical protein